MKAQITPSGRFIGAKKVGPLDDRAPTNFSTLMKLIGGAILALLILWAFAVPQIRAANALTTSCYETGC